MAVGPKKQPVVGSLSLFYAATALSLARQAAAPLSHHECTAPSSDFPHAALSHLRCRVRLSSVWAALPWRVLPDTSPPPCLASPLSSLMVPLPRHART
jgi:hypothetical protein